METTAAGLKSPRGIRWLGPLLCLALWTGTAKAEDFTYTTNGSVVTITGYIGSGGDVIIPEATNGLLVTGIGEGAFRFCGSVTRVTIPTSVTNIGDEAFASCSGLTNVTIGAGVIRIGTQVFNDCNNLEAIVVNGANPAYSSMAGVLFDHDQATIIRCPQAKAGDYTVPASVSNIAERAFDRCASLTNVLIQDNVTNIGAEAFADCYALETITVTDPNSVYCSLDGVLFSESHATLIRCPGGRIDSYTIPSSVTHIEVSAFDACNSLTNVTIPTTVISMGSNVFGFCPSLLSITVNEPNDFYRSEDGVLFNDSQTTLLRYPGGKPGSYTIPGSVTVIADEAFASSLNLTNVTIPGTVTTIGEKAFFFCESLASITIPDSVTSIGDNAFYVCRDLTNSVIGNGLTNLGFMAFGMCESLARITLGDSLTVIDGCAFEGCTNLTSLTIPSGVTQIDYRAFGNCENLAGLYFLGDAPELAWFVFEGADQATVYSLPGTTGWEDTFGGRSIVSPRVRNDAAFGVQADHFGFTITGTNGLVIVVEACTNLAAPAWSPVGTNTFAGDASYFSDSRGTDRPCCFYRLRWP